MIKFNELRISEDKQYMKVNCQVETLEGYSDVYINGVYAIPYKNFKPTASRKSDYDSSDYVTLYNGAPSKHIEICKSRNFFPGQTLQDSLYFIMVTHEGEVSFSLTNYNCTADEEIAYAVILDWERIYKEGMQFVLQFFKNCGTNCSDNKAFEDFVLRWEAFKLAIATCDWVLVSELWDSLFKRTSAHVSSGCGCGKMI